jgi:hypothetical protein
MRPGQRRLALPALAFSLAIALAVPYGVAAEEPEPPGPHTQNLHLLGASLRPGAVTGPPPAGPGDVPWDTRNTDLAFWGKTVIQGRYDGFRVIDVREPDNPRELAFFECVSDQGDVGIWRNLVFRSVNSGQQTDECRTTPQPMSRGWEGIQIFDISDLQDIRQVGAVPLDCGSHTHTVVPDLSENRVLIYNSTSQSNNEAPGPFPNQCSDPFNRFDIVEVPLDAPDTAQVIGSASLGVGHDGMPIEMCHDIGVIQGRVNKAACAGHHDAVVFDISDPANPVRLFPITQEAVASVSGWHSAAFTWDGKIIALGWEPGGGTRPRCQETGAFDGNVMITDEMKTIFFHDATTGEEVGRWVLPRPQSQWENCTIHNYNIAPLKNRYVLVHGSYQSGTSVVDFTDPTNAYEVAWMDPPPLDPPSDTSPGGRTTFRGGDWSSYWYNGLIYESDARRGLYIWNLSAREVAGPKVRLDYLNPQTSHLSIP